MLWCPTLRRHIMSGCVFSVQYYQPVIFIVEIHWKVKVLSRVQLFATPQIVAHQAPLFVRFSRQEYQSGLPFPSPGDLPNPGIKPMSQASPALASGFFTTEPPGNYSSNLWRLIFQCHIFFVFSYC